MSTDPIAELQEIVDLLASFDGPAAIRRADELDGVIERVTSCAAELADVTEPDDLQQRFAFAVRALSGARKAARAHRRNPLTRPLSQMRFAANVGGAGGWLQGALERLQPADESTSR